MTYNTNTIGTCSLCGGAVTVPSLWGGIIPPTPTCSRCGAVPREPHGPVIPMQPKPAPRLLPEWDRLAVRPDAGHRVAAYAALRAKG